MIYMSIWTEFKRFVQMVWCYKRHLSIHQKRLISLNRYVKCSKCEAQYFEIKYKCENDGQVNV